MKRLLLALFIPFFMIAGCGVTLSDYEDAVLEGVSNLNLNKPEKAFEDFSRAIDIDPSRADAYLGRANTLSTLGRYEEAKRASTKRPSRIMKRPWSWTLKSTMRRVSWTDFSAMTQMSKKVSVNTWSI
jgi:hypothetical protein